MVTNVEVETSPNQFIPTLGAIVRNELDTEVDVRKEPNAAASHVVPCGSYHPTILPLSSRKLTNHPSASP